MKTGIELIAEERQEQIEKHGRTVQWDVANNPNGELIQAAVALLTGSGTFPPSWDFKFCVKLNESTHRKKLIVAAALIAAEIDRIDAE